MLKVQRFQRHGWQWHLMGGHIWHGTTDIYDDLLTRKQTGQLMDDECEGFQWALVLIWIDWQKLISDWLYTLLFVCWIFWCFRPLLCRAMEWLKQICNGHVTKKLMTKTENEAMITSTSQKQVLDCLFHKTTDNSQTILWRNQQVQYDSFDLHLAKVQLWCCCLLSGISFLKHFQEENDAVAHVSYM